MRDRTWIKDYIYRPNQRISLKEKQKPDWYIQMSEWVINTAFQNNDKFLTKAFLKAANGEVDEQTYDYVNKNYVNKSSVKVDLYGKIRNVDFITPIVEKYMGEFINMFSNYTVFNNNPDIALKRNVFIREKMVPYLSQVMVNMLNEKGMQTGQESVPIEDLETTYEKILCEWIDDVVVDAQHRLELFNAITKAKNKYIEAYYYWFTCEECYTYRYILNNEVYFESINPLEYYRIDTGHRYVEDDDGGVRYWRMSLPEVIDRFRDKISDKELRYIKHLSDIYTNNRTDERFAIIQDLDDFGNRRNVFGELQQALNEVQAIRNGQIDVYHWVYKSEKPQYILKYKNILGEEREKIVDEHYKLDTTLGDIKIEKEWVNEFLEGWRIGGRVEGVYIKPEPIPVQREKFSNTSQIKSPYNGIVSLIPHKKRNPIPYRILPYQALYRIYTLQQERAVNKFKSWLIFPESLIADSGQMTTEQRLAQANKDNILFYDNTETENINVTNQIKEIVTNGVVQYIQLLEELKRGLKLDAWELANMNDARAGTQAAYAGKAVSELNYQNALTGSIWSLETFNGFREKDYIANVDHTKVAWADGKQGSYVDPNTNEVVMVDILQTLENSDSIAIHIMNNSTVNDMLSQLKQYAFNLGQNGVSEVALEAITNTDINSLKRNIKKGLEADKEFQIQLKQAEKEIEAQIEQIKLQSVQEQQSFDAEQNQLDRDKEFAIKKMEIDAKFALEQLRWNVDTNHNGYIDKEEADFNAGTSDLDNVKIAKELNK